ncbi:hypothetical protein EMCRGX_G030368 [Ephydatia muelleri]
MSKPLLLPEPYGGEAGGWAEWVDHFENVATVNKWATGEEKLKWLKVRLTGKAQTAFKKLPQDVKENYGECMKSLQRRFDPDSKRQLYVAELSARTRHKDEDWATFGDVLRVLACGQSFLAQIENAQVAFGVKQKRPTNVEEAVVATIELESYLGSSGKPLRVSAVSPQEPDPDVRVRRADRAEAVAAVSPLDEPQTVKLLGERLQRLEMLLERQGSSTRPRTSILAIPLEFTMDFSNSTVSLSWVAPDSLHVSTPPTISHYVLSNNLTNGTKIFNNPTTCNPLASCNYSLDLRDPFFTTDGNTTMLDYNGAVEFTLLAVNGAGNGNAATFTYIMPRSIPTDVPNQTVPAAENTSSTPASNNTTSAVYLYGIVIVASVCAVLGTMIVVVLVIVIAVVCCFKKKLKWTPNYIDNETAINATNSSQMTVLQGPLVV